MILFWLCIVFLVTILAVLLWQDWPYLDARRVRITAEVTGHRTGYDKHGITRYYPEVTFVDETGSGRTITDSHCSYFLHPAVGESLNVVYPGGAPEHARIAHPFWRTVMYLVLVGSLGLLLLLSTGLIEL